MTVKIYNTLNRQKEDFIPIEQGKVKMYVCGPTVYDSCHIGHARSVVVFDVIVRYLRAVGYDVTYVRNFTDVDDKIIKRANELNVDSTEIAEKYIKEFHEDMDALNVKRADIEPKATEHIQQIINVTETLIDKKMAYEVDGDVFFTVETFDGYGKLSGRKLDDMEAGARIEIDKRKKNPFDFVLWKSSKPDEPSWDSPWGKGRPGWHIECSAMSSEYLGKTFDIHGGGKDLIFPHHENEIAQSEAAFDRPFAKFWVHNGFVKIDDEKISKSLGNAIVIKDILKAYHPEALRLFLLSKHYRSPIDFTDQAIDEATSGLDKMYALLDRIESNENVGPVTDTAQDQATGKLWESFCDAMNDDFNTALGIGLLFNAVRDLNRLLDEQTDLRSEDAIIKIQTERADILKIGSILGILSEVPSEYFSNKKSSAVKNADINPDEIEQMILERAEARKAKDFSRADQIRDKLDAMNIILEDKPEGTVWKIKDTK